MDIDALKAKAKEIRYRIADMCVRFGGHCASSFSNVEILVTLYHGGVLRNSPETMDDDNRDRFILSKGHGETGYYAVLADVGYFPQSWIETSYRQGDCKLAGHPEIEVPGVEITSGALGHGLNIGCGISLAAQMNGQDHLQFVLMGDAECTEGSVWEAASFAASQKLHRLVGIIDRNHIGSIDYTNKYTSLEPLAEKWEKFGWEAISVDGHDFEKLFEVFEYARTRKSDKPLMIVAETVKGKGVSFMENDPIWHVKGLTDPVEIELARKELS